MTYGEILQTLREFEQTRFRSDPELKEAIMVTMYDAIVAILHKLAEREEK